MVVGGGALHAVLQDGDSKTVRVGAAGVWAGNKYQGESLSISPSSALALAIRPNRAGARVAKASFLYTCTCACNCIPIIPLTPSMHYPAGAETDIQHDLPPLTTHSLSLALTHPSLT